MIIAVDSGKHTLKAAIRGNEGNSRYVVFRNKMLKLKDYMDVDIVDGSFLVGWGNDRFIVGDQAEERSFNVSKTEIIHKLAAYVAIAQLAGNNLGIRLVVGCPLIATGN